MDTIQHTDVVVLGGGSAGVAAAVAAARKGLRVILIERNDFWAVKQLLPKWARYAVYIISVKLKRQPIL